VMLSASIRNVMQSEQRRMLGTISFAEALPLDHKGTPSERTVIIYESANGGGNRANAIHPHR
jgi:hypothetical protein